MRKISRIIVHCAASKGDVSAKTIKSWHLERGWRDIGYHYVIRRNGTIELGRPVAESGAHVQGKNKDSIGVCLAGGYGGSDNYTDQQMSSLRTLCGGLIHEHGKLGVMGHNDFTNAKTCPNFNVAAWWLGVNG